MKQSKSILCALGLLLVCVCLATAADAPTITFKFKTVKIPGSTSTEPGGINNAGDSVGFYVDSAGADHGYILSGKKVTTLDDPNATAGTTEGSNLNPDGAISVVGFYTSSKTGNPVGFVYKGGKFKDIVGPKGAVAVYGAAINDSGAIVGYYTDSSGVYHGYLLKNGKYTTLNVPGAADTFATGINTSGSISFYWVNSSSGVYESSVLTGKTYKTVNVPGASDSFALDLNTAGDVTYEWEDSNGAIHGALLHAAKYYKFNYPKAADTYGGGINDKSEIVGGYASSGSGPWSAFQASY
jgi:probable HAF family extracellular repeat protein